MPDAAIECRGLARWYGERPALLAVSFEVAEGQRLAVFGSNGAGKSTLLRIVATLLTPTEGSVFLHGVDIARDGAGARRLLGFVGHEPGIYGDLTAEENLRFFARLGGVRESDAVSRMLKRAGLHGARRQRARTLSRGQRQRLGLARSLITDPAILVLDEPDTGLDAEATGLVEEVIGADKRTTLFATHDRDWGSRIADDVLVLDRGRLIEQRSVRLEPVG